MLDPRSVVLVLTSVCHLLLGGVVLAHNSRERVHRAVALQAFLFALWAFIVAGLWIPPLCRDLVLCGRLAHSVALVVVASFMTVGALFPDGRWALDRRLYAALWAAGVLLAAVVLTTPLMIVGARFEHGVLRGTYGPLQYLYFVYALTCVGCGLGCLVARYRRAQGVRRLQIQYMLTGLGMCIALNVPTNIIGPLLGVHASGWIGPVFSLAFVGMVTHSIVRHRLMGVRVFIGQHLVDLLAVALAALLSVVLLRLAQYALGPQPLWSSTLVVLVVALSYHPHRAAVQRTLARYFYRTPYEYHPVVRSATQMMATTLDVERVLDCLLATVGEALQVEHALVLMPASAAYRARRAYRACAELDEFDLEGIEIPAESELVARLREAREPLVRDEVAAACPAGGDRALAEEMARLHAEVAAPLLSGDILAAVLLVGPKLSGDEFTAQDTNLLATLGTQAAVGVTNSLLHQQALDAEKLARENAELYRQAQEANAAKDRMLAVVSHELRNPLAPILAGVGVLRSAPARDSSEARVLDIIAQSARLQARMVEDLLDFARVTRDALPLHPTTISLDTVVLAAVQTQRADAEQGELSLRVGEESGLYVHADADRMQQVVMNLLANAIKFTPPGGEVRIRCEAQGPATARIVAEDTGIGIDPPLREHLFEMFRQGDVAGQRRPGLGIGLALVRAIVERHGGRVWAESEGHGKGSRFTVELPAVPAPAVSLPEAPRVGNGHGQRLLLVEDNPDTRLLIVTGLERLGYKVHGTGSAEHALELAPQLRPDLLLADLGLPGMDGCELLRRLRALPGLERLVAFAVTARSSDEDVRRVREAGYTAHFIKPVDPAVLHDAVRAALQGDPPLLTRRGT